MTHTERILMRLLEGVGKTGAYTRLQVYGTTDGMSQEEFLVVAQKTLVGLVFSVAELAQAVDRLEGNEPPDLGHLNV